MEKIALLEKIGLTRNEANVYMSLLEYGPCSAGTLLKKTRMHRSRVYESLERLREKGIISFVVKEYKRFYRADDPERILTYLEERKNRINESESSVRRILPELRSMMRPERREPEARVYDGVEGIKAIHNDWIRCKGDMLVWGGRSEIYVRMKYYVMQLEKEMKKRGKKFVVLSDYDVKNSAGQRRFMERGLLVGRYLPKEFTSPAVIFIYDDRVVNVIWTDAKHPVGFMIINRDLAEKYMKYFWAMWKMAKPLEGRVRHTRT